MRHTWPARPSPQSQLIDRLFGMRAALGRGDDTLDERQQLYDVECCVRRGDSDYREQAIAVIGAEAVVGEVETDYDHRQALRRIDRLKSAKEGSFQFLELNALADAVLRYEAKSACSWPKRDCVVLPGERCPRRSAAT